MIKFALCLFALAACGLSDKNRCDTASDCNAGLSCLAGVCQPTDHDACGASHTRCAADASCTQSADAAACTCNAGFTGDGATCADVDECAAADSPCTDHAACTNSAGAFACSCEAGFTGDGTTHCTPASFQKVVAAGGFTCGLAASGGIYCWGANWYGELGDGTLLPRPFPTQVGTDTDWIDVDAHALVGCGLKRDHSMWCWGYGIDGELGDGKSQAEHTMTQVVSDKPGVGWQAMAVGRQLVCGLHDDGSAACWGRDRVGGGNVGVPATVDANTDWTVLSAGTTMCGIRGMPGALYCWGQSSDGMLGLGEVTSQATPARVGTDLWKTVRVGYDNTCGIRSDGALLCWGNSPFVTSLQYGKTPHQVGTATDWQSIDLSLEVIIGLRAGGQAYGWGANDAGALPLPLAPDVPTPTPLLSPVGTWAKISSGNFHGCGIAAGQTYCWGSYGEGFLGEGTVVSLYSPTKIGDDHYTAIAGGPGACGVRSDGALMCWGYSLFGIGFGNLDPVWAPTRLGTDTWTGVAGGSSLFGAATCAIRNGTPSCWGINSSGQLGIGRVSDRELAPVAMSTPSGTQWTELALAAHTCGITSDARLWCWGSNAGGELGTGAAGGDPITAPSAPLPGTWLHVGATESLMQAGGMTCGIKTDHTLWCWGFDQYPLSTQHLVPTQVGNEASWASLSLGSISQGTATCAIKLDGSLWCWGQQLGDGTLNTSPTPVQVGSDHDWASVKVGSETCAIKTGGTLWCWGNGSVVLGDGKPDVFDDHVATSQWTPTQIGSDSDWRTVETDLVSATMSCALKTDGSLWCWGAAAAPVPGVATSPVPVR